MDFQYSDLTAYYLTCYLWTMHDNECKVTVSQVARFYTLTY